MTLQSQIDLMEQLVSSMRSIQQQASTIETQRDGLVKSNEYMQGEIAQLEKRLAQVERERNEAIENAERNAEIVGKLSESLRSVLTMHMNLATHATEGLRALDTKPRPLHEKTMTETLNDSGTKAAVEAAETTVNSDHSAAENLTYLEQQKVKAQVRKDVKDALAAFAVGIDVVIDPPADYNQPRLKYWYERHTGFDVPDWDKKPSLVFIRGENGLKYLHTQPREGVESQPPFRTSVPSANVESSGGERGDERTVSEGEIPSGFNPPIPNFLKAGPRSYHDNERRHAIRGQD